MKCSTDRLLTSLAWLHCVLRCSERKHLGCRLREEVAAPVPQRSRVPVRQPRRADRSPSLPGRALGAHPPHQPLGADLRREPATDQGHRPPARRAHLPIAGLGGAGSCQHRVARTGDLGGRRRLIGAGCRQPHGRRRGSSWVGPRTLPHALPGARGLLTLTMAQLARRRSSQLE